jgi:signal transduction histidine kinase
VFERFRQLDGGATRRIGGTGLGLAIAREFAELQGGTLRVQSAPEGGASFWATLPLRRDETSASSGARRDVGAAGRVAPPMATPGGFDAGRASETALAHVAALNTGRRSAATSSLGRSHAASVGSDGRRDVPLVLVVEDNPEMNAFISSALTASYHVAIAFDGKTGLERALALRPSVIIADVMMPEVDGASMLRHLRRRPDFATTPILLLTAKADDELRMRMLREGAQDVLVKPFALEELKARLENLTTSRQLAPLAEANAQWAESFRNTRLELERAYAELRATQDQLGQTAKMASLGQLMVDIAHELSEPLALVQGHLDAGRHDLDGAAAEVAGSASETRRERFPLAQDRLRQAGAGLERIRELVSKLRMFSRPETGERRRVSVRECVESTLALLDHRLGDRISVDVDLDAVDVIDGYPALLNQALMNLLANSIAAISDKGRIAVTSHWAPDGYRIEVRDSGQGIPHELRDRVFEPFFTTRPIGHGTGLGLSITDSIIKKHGGRIEIAEAEGGGTRVILHFPPIVAGATARSSGAPVSV